MSYRGRMEGHLLTQVVAAGLALLARPAWDARLKGNVIPTHQTRYSRPDLYIRVNARACCVLCVARIACVVCCVVGVPCVLSVLRCWCRILCVLCVLCSVCIAYCVLCIVHCVLCIVYCVLCTIVYIVRVLCIVCIVRIVCLSADVCAYLVPGFIKTLL